MMECHESNNIYILKIHAAASDYASIGEEKYMFMTVLENLYKDYTDILNS